MPAANTVIDAVSVTASALPWWSVALLALACVLAAFWFYRGTVPPVAGWHRYGITALRAFVLLLVVFGLAEPVLRVTATVSRQSLTAVLVDTSSSMAEPADPGRSRAAQDSFETLRARLGNAGVYSAFDTGSRTAPSQLRFAGSGTDIAAALAFAAGMPDVTSAVLISDGRSNLGGDPLTAARALRIPVHTVAAGSPREVRDVSLVNVSASPVGRDGASLPVEVTVSTAAPFEEPVRVVIAEDGAVAASGSVTLRETAAGVLSIPLPLRGTGRHDYTIELSAPGDANPANNRREFSVNVLKDTFSVLLIGARPAYDLAFVRRAIEADSSFSLDLAVGQGAAGEIPSALPADLSPYDIIVLLDGGDGLLTRESSILIRDRIAAGAGFWLLGSTPPGPAAEELERLMPLRMAGIEAAGDTSYTLVPTEAGRSHFVTSSSLTAEDVWQSLPPLASVLSSKPAPGSVVLARAFADTSESRALPAIATGVLGRGKVLIMPVSGIWRWSLMLSGMGREDRFLEGFITGALHWLTAETDASPLTVSTGSQSWLAGQGVTFEARLFDNVFSPLAGAEIMLVIDDDSSTRIILAEERPAVYTAVKTGLAPGTHRYRAVAYREGSQYAESSGSFTVQEFSLEMLNPQADPRTLQAISALTGGVAVSPAGIDSVLAAIHPETITERRDREYHPAFNPFVLYSILGLLALEWGIRKRRGMI